MASDDALPETDVPPHVRRALGPALAGFVGQTPLDQEAADQIAAILDNAEVDDLRGPMVSVALMNCLERRVAEAEAEIADLKALSQQIALQAKSSA